MGKLPQTSASPPVLAKGTASLVAIRIFKELGSGGACGGV
jgi:hypothetical protein